MTFQTKTLGLVAAALIGAAVTPLSAQRFVMHPKQALARGNLTNDAPFAWTPNRFQQVMHWNSFGGNLTLTMKRIRFRLPGWAANGKYGGQRVRLTIALALATKDASPQKLSTTFAKNYELSTLKTVVSNRTITLPKLKSVSFGFVIPFDSGKSFYYRAANRRHLLLDIRVHWNSEGSKRFNYPIDSFRGKAVGETRRNGSYLGCRSAKTGKAATIYGEERTLRVGTLHYTSGNCWTDRTPGFFLLGSRPISATLPGGCLLVNDIVVMLGRMSSGSNGRTQFAMRIPDDRFLRGASFYTQMLWYQPGANSSGLITSPGLMQKIASDPDLIVQSYVFGAGQFGHLFGTVRTGEGLIVAFDG